MSYEEAIKYMSGAIDIEKIVARRMFVDDLELSTQTVYYFYLSLRNPNISENMKIAGYFSRHSESEYAEFLQSIKEFETWEDAKTFYAI